MENIDDETDRRAREGEAERRKRRERELREQTTGFRASDRMSRDAVHDRGLCVRRASLSGLAFRGASGEQ